MDKQLYPIKTIVITHPYANFNGGLVKPLLKLDDGWSITSYTE